MTDRMREILKDLAEWLHLTRPLIIFDFETTGPSPREDRVVEIGLIQLRPDGSFKEWRSLVDPERPIPEGSTEKHGITDARVKACAVCARNLEEHKGGDDCQAFKPVPRFGDLASNLLVGFTGSDLCGFNIKGFDVTVLGEEFKRAKVDWSAVEARILDGYRLWQVVHPRSLEDFVRCFADETLEDAHHAMADVYGTALGLHGLFRKHPEIPRDLTQLHDLQWPKQERQPNWIDDAGKFQWRDGKAICAFGKKANGIEMKLIEKRFYKWMLDPAQDFGEDTKRVCRDALVGKFPTQQPQESLPLPVEDPQ